MTVTKLLPATIDAVDSSSTEAAAASPSVSRVALPTRINPSDDSYTQSQNSSRNASSLSYTQPVWNHPDTSDASESDGVQAEYVDSWTSTGVATAASQYLSYAAMF